MSLPVFAHRVPATLAAAALGVFVVTLPAFADVIERSFDVGASGKLRLESDTGAVRIDSHPAGRVDVRVVRDGRHGEELRVDMAQRGNEIIITGDLPDRDRQRGWHELEVEFVIRLPRGFDLDIETAGGSIDIDDLDGEVEAYTAGGSIRLAELGGSVVARTAGGSIELESSGGDVKLKTAGGSISISRAGGTVEANTAGGSISVEEAEGAVRARTAGGSIRIGRSGGDVEAHTSGGSVSIEDVYGAVDASTAGGSITARLRTQPSGNSELRTFGGNVTVTLADGLALDIDARSSNSRVRSDFDFPAGAWDDDESSLEAALNGGGPALRIRASQTVRLRRE
jgi:DUF4097 and DUF4098 domain-containing protein YvlB